MNSKPLVSANLTGVSHRYSEVLQFCPAAKDAIIAGVSHSLHKLHWVPLEKSRRYVIDVASSACAVAPDRTRQSSRYHSMMKITAIVLEALAKPVTLRKLHPKKEEKLRH